jgi:hypothetical protein
LTVMGKPFLAVCCVDVFSLTCMGGESDGTPGKEKRRTPEDSNLLLPLFKGELSETVVLVAQ